MYGLQNNLDHREHRHFIMFILSSFVLCAAMLCHYAPNMYIASVSFSAVSVLLSYRLFNVVSAESVNLRTSAGWLRQGCLSDPQTMIVTTSLLTFSLSLPWWTEFEWFQWILAVYLQSPSGRWKKTSYERMPFIFQLPPYAYLLFFFNIWIYVLLLICYLRCQLFI
jgi:hypothetical protein